MFILLIRQESDAHVREKGNPQASNLFAVIHYLQEQEGIHLEVKARKVA